jgi:hypothetical protein
MTNQNESRAQNNQRSEWYGIVTQFKDIADNDPDDARRILSCPAIHNNCPKPRSVLFYAPHDESAHDDAGPTFHHGNSTANDAAVCAVWVDGRPGILLKTQTIRVPACRRRRHQRQRKKIRAPSTSR